MHFKVSQKKRGVWVCPTAPSHDHSFLATHIGVKGFSGNHSVLTKDLNCFDVVYIYKRLCAYDCIYKYVFVNLAFFITIKSHKYRFVFRSKRNKVVAIVCYSIRIYSSKLILISMFQRRMKNRPRTNIATQTINYLTFFFVCTLEDTSYKGEKIERTK